MACHVFATRLLRELVLFIWPQGHIPVKLYSNMSIHERAFEIVVSKTSAILLRSELIHEGQMLALAHLQ